MDVSSSAAYAVLQRARRAAQSFPCPCTQAFTVVAAGIQADVHVAAGRPGTLLRLVGWPAAWSRHCFSELQAFVVEGAPVLWAPASAAGIPAAVDDTLLGFASQVAQGAAAGVGAKSCGEAARRRLALVPEVLLWLPSPDAASMTVADAVHRSGARAAGAQITSLASACPFAAGFCWTVYPHYERMLVGRPPSAVLADAFRASAARAHFCLPQKVPPPSGEKSAHMPR